MRNVLVALSLILLAACATGSGEPAPQAAPVIPVESVEAIPVAPLPDLKTVKVALLLPLSGEQIALGKNLQKAAELAVTDIGRENFELIAQDSGSSPRDAEAAAKAALKRGAQVIIGPVFSGPVSAVKPVAKAANVPVLALSNDTAVAGGGAWLMGYSPVEQVRRVASFAASQGITNLAVLAPSTLYGDLALAALKEAGSGVNVVALARYRNNEAAIRAAVDSLAENRAQVQAVFLPEGGAALHKIAAELARHNMAAGKLRLLGTGLWESDDVAENPNLSGGWYAVPDPAMRASFNARYAKNFGLQPPRLASLVYDAVSLTAALSARGAAPPFTEGPLTSPDGFAGVDGIFRLTPGGATERGLAIMELSRGKARLLDAAPKKF